MRALISILVIFVAGCAATKGIQKGYTLQPGSGKGLIVVSISYQGSSSGYSIYYTNDKREYRGKIQFGAGMALIPIPPKGDYSHLKRKGKVFAVEVPAGNYEIYNWLVFSGYATIEPSSDISVKFKVEPGKATYVGNFDFVQTESMGLTVTGVDVNYSEQFEVDMSILFEKYPNILPDEIFMGVNKDMRVNGIGGVGRTSWDIPLVIM